MTDRATSPVLGIVLLIVITAVLAGTVGSVALETPVPSDSPRVVLDLQVNADEDRFTFVHRGGDALDVTEVSIRVRIDGVPLDEQPPVPFFSASGFEPGPTGPFNSATDHRWEAGETASFSLAGTNDPLVSEGSNVVVEFVVGDTVVARVDA